MCFLKDAKNLRKQPSFCPSLITHTVSKLQLEFCASVKYSGVLTDVCIQHLVSRAKAAAHNTLYTS